MKISVTSLSILLLFLTGCGSQNSSSWKSPDYKKETYRTVMVLAKTTNKLAQKQIEDATVQELKTNGIKAIPSYDAIKASDLETESVFMEKANTLQVDALVVYNFGKVKSEYKRKPSVNASLGVPVRLGIFRGFLGTDVPLAGGDKIVETVNSQVGFYTRDSSSIQWSHSLSGDLKNDTQVMASDFANKTVSKMLQDNLF